MSGLVAPVQGDYRHRARGPHPLRVPPGMIDWDEHLTVFEAYARRCGRDQSAARIAERGGFGYDEIVRLTGAAPKTWRPRHK